MARLAWLVLGTALCLTVSCGNTPRSPVPPSPSATIRLPRPSAATGPCATVTATIPIDQAPPACAAVWAPYGVTKVPPANLTDSVPVPPEVVNDTGGAVTDAQAREWALASNRESVWSRWAEAHVQMGLLPHLQDQRLYPANELTALAAGGTIDQPPCALFPKRFKLFPLTPADHAFFSHRGQVATGNYLFAAYFQGPCTVKAHLPNGEIQVLATFTGSGTVLFTGAERPDPLLGPIWFADGGGGCDQSGAVQSRCAP